MDPTKSSGPNVLQLALSTSGSSEAPVSTSAWELARTHGASIPGGNVLRLVVALFVGFNPGVQVYFFFSILSCN